MSAANREPTQGASAPPEFDNQQAGQGETQNGKNNIDHIHYLRPSILDDPKTEALELLLARSPSRCERLLTARQ